MFAMLIAVAVSGPLCSIGKPPFHKIDGTAVCTDGTNLWSPGGHAHKFDRNGFLIASPQAKAKVKRECPSANPLYVEAYGKCPDFH